MEYVPKEPPKDSINISSLNPISFILRLCFFLFFLMGGMYLFMLLVPNMAAKATPAKWESFLGEKIQMDSDKNLSREVEALFNKIKPHLPKHLKNIKAYGMNSSIENAFAIPGGQVYLTSEFLKNAQSENEKLFVLAHEIAHVKHRDALSSFYQNFLLEGIKGFLGVEGAFTDLTLRLSQTSFSRQKEKRADLYALDVLYQTTGNVRGAANFFKRMKRKYGFWEGMEGRLFSSHPVSKDRIEYLREASQKYVK